MAIIQACAHQLIYSDSIRGQQLQLAQTNLNIDGRLEELLRELKHCYIGKAGKRYGQFDSDLGKSPMMGLLKDYLDEKQTLSAMTGRWLNQWLSYMEVNEGQLDGHALMFHEQLADGNFLYIFLLQHNEGSYLDGNLSLQSSRYLDTKAVRLGARVSLESFSEAESDNYLSILRARGDKEITEAFIQALGFIDKVDIAKETGEFLDIVSAYTQALPEPEARETRQKVVDYCLEQDKTGEAIQITALSEAVNDKQPLDLSEFIASRQSEPKAELIPDKAQLRQFVRISGRSDALSMSFSSECLGESVVYDANSDSLTITNLPASLKARLLKHLQAQ